MRIIGFRRMLGRAAVVLAAGAIGAVSVGVPVRAAEPVPPAAPQGVVATPGNTRVVVTWDAVTPPPGETITDYVVTSSAGTGCVHDHYLACPVTGVQNGTPITVRVSAAVGSVLGPHSAAVEVIPGVPTAPTAVTASPGLDKATVAFGPASDNGSPIVRYCGIAHDGTDPARGHQIACGATGPVAVTGLTSGDSYTFTVRATNALGTGPPSIPSLAVIPDSVPGTPTDAVATPGDAMATVTFVPASGAVTFYQVTATDTTNPTNGGQTASGSGSPISIQGLYNGDTYTFTVTAFDGPVSGSPSTGSPPVVPTGSPSLSGTGSSFASEAIEEWVGATKTLFGLNVNWQVTSSIIGLNDFAANQVDFAGSDIPYSSRQAAMTPDKPYQYLPDIAFGLAFTYNLTGTNGQRITSLILDPAIIDRIFLGKITSWDDPAIAALNPQLAGDLPGTSITGVYRSAASGDNYLLSQYLINQDSKRFIRAQNDFSQPDPGQPSATWPTPPQGFDFATHPGYPGWKVGALNGQSYPEGAADYVAGPESNGAITYVPVVYAVEHDLPVASLVNASGAAVQPTSPDVATALQGATLQPDLTENLSGVFTDPSPSAYPLSGDSYFVVPCSPALAGAQGATCDGPDTASTFPAAKGQVLGQFIAFLACAGQEQMAELGYSPLPPNQVQQDFDAIGRITGGVEPPPPTAANCKNPTVDGQLPLPSG